MSPPDRDHQGEAPASPFFLPQDASNVAEVIGNLGYDHPNPSMMPWLAMSASPVELSYHYSLLLGASPLEARILAERIYLECHPGVSVEDAREAVIRLLEKATRDA